MKTNEFISRFKQVSIKDVIEPKGKDIVRKKNISIYIL